MDKVDTYIEKHQQWTSALKVLRALLLAHPFEEALKWNAPVYSAHGRTLVGMAAFKNHCSLWFYEGYLLEDPFDHLINAQEGKTKYLRQWKFTDDKEIDPEHIRKYLEETLSLAATHPAPRSAVSRDAKTVSAPSTLLNEALLKEAALQGAYNAFPPYKQKEFSTYIAEAKREATQQKRLEKVITLIRAGQGLNDKYR